jgi:hypothetical protein
MWAAVQEQMEGKFYILSTHCTVLQKGQALESVSQRDHLLDSKSDTGAVYRQ